MDAERLARFKTAANNLSTQSSQAEYALVFDRLNELFINEIPAVLSVSTTPTLTAKLAAVETDRASYAAELTPGTNALRGLGVK